MDEFSCFFNVHIQYEQRHLSMGVKHRLCSLESQPLLTTKCITWPACRANGGVVPQVPRLLARLNLGWFSR